MTTDPKDAEIARLRKELEKLRSDESYDTYRVRSLRERAEKAEAERDAALAQVAERSYNAVCAAAYETAATAAEIIDHAEGEAETEFDRGYDQACRENAEMIRKLTPADALAALSRRDAQMRAEGMRIAAEIAEDVPGDGENPWSWPDRIRTAILAAAENEATCIT